MRLESSLLIEVDKGLLDHGRQVGDDVPPLLLDPHCGAVHGGVGVHGVDKGSDAWFPGVSTCRWVGDCGSHEHYWLPENLRPHLWGEDCVDPTQLGIHLQA